MIKAIAIGCGTAIGVGVLAHLVFPGSFVTTAFLAPANLFVPAIRPVIPDRAMYAIITEGGAPAGAALVIGSSFIAWIVIGASMFLLSSWFFHRPIGRAR